MTTPKRAVLVAVHLAALSVLGCSATPFDSTPAAGTSAAEDPRSDPEPLRQYFPIIGAPVAVSWLGRDNSGGRAPGPSIYWIDAVVELQPDTAAALRTRYAPSESASPPDLPEVLRNRVPAGTYVTGTEFDAALGGAAEWGGSATGYLHTTRPVLVFTASAGG
ncbi:hypothetical protein [Nocardia sp. NPDC127526]|uniref:hypothetical protein n=1 Tax=Nocardia sp. NPDC127526 TaxID=3345393 RepID=UPI003638DD94